MSAPHVPSVVAVTARGQVSHPADTPEQVCAVVARLARLLPDATWRYKP